MIDIDLLACAVAIRVLDMQEVPLARLVAQAPSLGAYLMEHAGQAVSGKEAWQKIIDGIAILSLMPGGVTMMGRHFEFLHPDSEVCSASSAASMPPRGTGAPEQTSEPETIVRRT
jgi:hypothetical protein